MKENEYPIHHENSALEKVSEIIFLQNLPKGWIVDKPNNDFGVDFIVTPVSNNIVEGLYFSVQLKAKRKLERLSVRLKKSTLNYLFTRLEPTMVVLYDDYRKISYWKWLLKSDFDLSKDNKTFEIKFNQSQTLDSIEWPNITLHIQKIFKLQHGLSLSLEYDLFNVETEFEAKAWSHYFAQNFAEASFYFKKLLANTNNSMWLLALAQCEYSLYDYTNAIHTINKALEIENSELNLATKASILSEDGLKSQSIHKLKNAEKIFAELYSKNPSETNSYNYANTLSYLGEKDRAEELYNYAIKINPNNTEAWKNLGQLYNDTNQFEKALSCYNKALQTNPNKTEALISKGILIGQQHNKYEDALKLFEKALSLDKNIFINYSTIYFWLAHFNHELKELELALEWVNRGLDDDPSDEYLRRLKAEIFIKDIDSEQSLITEAITFFNDCLTIYPDDSSHYYYLCKATLIKNPNAHQVVFDWFVSQLDFHKNEIINTLVNYSIEDLLTCIKYWNSFRTYLLLYPIEDIDRDLKSQNIEHTKLFLINFLINRLIFLSQFTEILAASKKDYHPKSEIEALCNKTINLIHVDVLEVMITTSKDNDFNAFAEQLAQVISSISFIVMREFPRCMGYVIGNLFVERKESLEKLASNDTTSLATILRITQIIYKRYDLPM